MFRKNYIFVLLVLVLAGHLPVLGQDTLVGDDEYFLQMRGRVLQSKGQEKDEEKKGLDSAQISVTNEMGKQVIFGYTDSKGRLAFNLPLGRRFTIHISKPGYVQKMIAVDSHVPMEERKVFSFTFDIDIFEKVDGLDVSVLNQPVAKVTYKVIDKAFGYDATYTNKVNAGLQKMYRNYYLLKRKEQQAADSTNAVEKRDSGKAIETRQQPRPGTKPSPGKQPPAKATVPKGAKWRQ